MSRRILFLLVVAALGGAAEQGVRADEAKTPVAAPAVDFEAILRQPVKVEFTDTPLSDVVDFFSDRLDLNIQLDAKGLTDAAVDSSAPVTLSLRKPISFASTLRLILDNFDLTFVVQDEVLKITTKEKADELLTTKVYEVGDLLDRGPRRNFSDNLIETITETIQPDTWADHGGPGSISHVASTLVIAQKYDVHKELQELFLMLRAELPKRVIGENAAAPNADAMTTVVYKLEHAAGQETAAAIMAITDPSAWRPDAGAVAVVKMKNVIYVAQGEVDRSWDALVVRQTEAVQDKVQEFLGELGRLYCSDHMISTGPRGGISP